MSFMGIDIGTTGCKVVAFDQNGKSLASAYAEYPIISNQPGFNELDSKLVIDKCKKCISQVAADVKNSDPVIALAVSSQGEAFTLLDKDGNYLSNAFVSFDSRSTKQVKEYTEKLGLDFLYNTTGHSPHPLFSLFKLAWIKENHPDILDKARRLLCFQDLLGYELSGQAIIGTSLAARTMMWDINTRDWSQPILDSVGIDKSIMPKPIPAGQFAGKVKKQIADELNLSPDCIIAAGGHDQPCGALGAGVTHPGLAAYATGTVECITPAFENLLLNDTLKNSNLATYPHVVENLFVTVAFNLTGGNLLRWFRDEFAAEEKRLAKENQKDPYDLIMNQIPAEPTNLMVLPHFVSTGTPYFDTSPTGAVLGLSLSTTRGEFIKSLLEGVTYEMRLNLEILASAGIKVNQLRAVGGGAKSEIWMQIKADIMNVPIEALDITEAGCLGSAMLAAVAAQKADSVTQLAELWVKPNKIFEPCKKNAMLYNHRYQIYKDLYKTVKPVGQKLAKLI